MSQSTYTLFIFVVMIVGFFAAYWWGNKKNIPISVYIVFTAILGALVAGEGIPIRHLIEGLFNFLDTVAIIITASIFIVIQRESGAMNTIVRDIVSGFSKNTPIMLIILMFFVMLPGAFTGSGTAAVMAVGGTVGIILTYLGLPKRNVTAFIAIGGILGLTAPPINIPAMIVSNGINMPYAGFTLPLLLLSIPLGVIFALFYGAKYVDRSINPNPILEKIPESTVMLGRFGAYFPLFLVLGLFIFQSVFPGKLPILGNPLIFTIGSIPALVVSPKKDIIGNTKTSLKEVMPVCAILISVGALVQIMALTGVRGLFVISALTAPRFLVYIALMIGLPLSGSILGTYGSAAAFAVPLMLALLGTNPIVETAGIAFICSLATLCPPSAIVGNASIIVTNYDEPLVRYYRMLIVPAITISVIGILIIIYSSKLKWLV